MATIISISCFNFCSCYKNNDGIVGVVIICFCHIPTLTIVILALVLVLFSVLLFVLLSLLAAWPSTHLHGVFCNCRYYCLLCIVVAITFIAGIVFSTTRMAFIIGIAIISVTMIIAIIMFFSSHCHVFDLVLLSSV